MKFNKALLTGIQKSELLPHTLEIIGALSKEVVFYPENGPKLRDHLSTTDCLLVKFNPVSGEMINFATNLKYIGAMSTGYARIDTASAKKKGITVTNVPGYSTESVAEFVIAAILENIRGLEIGKDRSRKENYSEIGIKATEIKGKVFGVLGLGSIGGRVAQIAKGFDADVRYWSRHRKKGFEAKGITYQDADKLIAESDFLSVNLAQNYDTNNFLNAKRMNSLKKGAIVINTTPMELVDIDALAKRLAKDDITFILDHSDEMSKEDLAKLSKYKNCVIYPPMAYITDEARIAKQEIFVSNMENFLKGLPTNVVN